MNEVTQILDAVACGDTMAAEQLLPLAYAELRRMAAMRMAQERGDHTLQPTALVHEAYLKLTGPGGEGRRFANPEHFFAEVAGAMRRVLIDSARRRQASKRGGDWKRTVMDSAIAGPGAASDDVLAIDEALVRLEAENPELAQVVNLRYFAGMSIAETAAAMGVSESKVDRSWRIARAWLLREMNETASPDVARRSAT